MASLSQVFSQSLTVTRMTSSIKIKMGRELWLVAVLALGMACLAMAGELSSETSAKRVSKLGEKQENFSTSSMDRKVVSSSNIVKTEPEEGIQNQVFSKPRKSKKKEKTLRRTSDCEYEKGAWQECQANGIQERRLKLKSGANSRASCEPSKTIRRECSLGCKYARGEWSAFCVDGLRQRVDSLVSRSQTNSSSSSPMEPSNCQPKRKVSKDCKRACHYIKSDWSECLDGYKTRNMTLDESVLDRRAGSPSVAGLGCAKLKSVRRECRARPASRRSETSQRAKVRQKTKQQQQSTTKTSEPATGEPLKSNDASSETI